MVGDPEQLPPSTFFERQLDLDPDEDPAEDTRLSKNMRASSMLRWRSINPSGSFDGTTARDTTSLIAFSNAEFYRNRLLVFPSPARQGTSASAFNSGTSRTVSTNRDMRNGTVPRPNGW